MRLLSRRQWSRELGFVGLAVLGGPTTAKSVASVFKPYPADTAESNTSLIPVARRIPGRELPQPIRFDQLAGRPVHISIDWCYSTCGPNACAIDDPSSEGSEVLTALLAPLLGLVESELILDSSRFDVSPARFQNKNEHEIAFESPDNSFTGNLILPRSLELSGQRKDGRFSVAIDPAIRMIVASSTYGARLSRNQKLYSIERSSNAFIYQLHCVLFPEWKTTVRVRL